MARTRGRKVMLTAYATAVGGYIVVMASNEASPLRWIGLVLIAAGGLIAWGLGLYWSARARRWGGSSRTSSLRQSHCLHMRWLALWDTLRAARCRRRALSALATTRSGLQTTTKRSFPKCTSSRSKELFGYNEAGSTIGCRLPCTRESPDAVG